MSNSESLLTALRNEDSVLFSVDRATRQMKAASIAEEIPAQTGSGVLPFAELAADYFAEQIQPESSSVSLLALPGYAGDAGGANGSLLLPTSAPASLPRPDRPRILLALSLALMLLGLTTSAIAALLVIRVAPSSSADGAASAEPLDITPMTATPDYLIPAEEPLAAVAPAIPDQPAPTVEPEPVRPTATVRRPVAKKPAPKKTSVSTPKPAPPSGPKPCADEIECLLAGVDADPAPAAPAAPEPAPNLPDKLDSFMISSTMKSATRRAASCDDQFGSGNVTVRITVAPSGEVTRVVVAKTPNPDLGACVAAAAEKAKFPATRSGATFAYLFPYR